MSLKNMQKKHRNWDVENAQKTCGMSMIFFFCVVDIFESKRPCIHITSCVMSLRKMSTHSVLRCFWCISPSHLQTFLNFWPVVARRCQRVYGMISTNPYPTPTKKKLHLTWTQVIFHCFPRWGGPRAGLFAGLHDVPGASLVELSVVTGHGKDQ